MKIALVVVTGIVALAFLAALIAQIVGSRLPRNHRAQLSIVLRANRADVWTAITDYSAMSRWWPAVKAVRIEKTPDGTELTWNTDSHNKQIAFRTKSERPGSQLVREIVAENGPFGGTWTYDLVDVTAGETRLTLTEDGFINPPIFRAIATWGFGLDHTMKDYATHLEKHLANKNP